MPEDQVFGVRLEGGIRKVRHDSQAVDECYVRCDVLGWTVEATASPDQPFDGPGELHVWFSATADTAARAVANAEHTHGISAQVLRTIPLGPITKYLAALKADALRNRHPVDIPARIDGETDLAHFAATYATLAAEGHSQPLQHLSRLSGLSRNTLSARIRRAREAGLLTRPGKGDLGALTDRAKRLLAEHQEG